MIVPALLYQHFGWKAVCCGAAAAALLYILLSCLVRRLESPASREAVSEFEPHVEGTCTDISWIDSGPNKEVPRLLGNGRPSKNISDPLNRI